MNALGEVAQAELTGHALALLAKQASRVLATLDEAARNAALEAMAAAVERASAALLAANADCRIDDRRTRSPRCDAGAAEAG
jgi:gamma-glutamyl phosphate reductase